MSFENYKLNCNPKPIPENVVEGEGYRIIVLTESLIRLEYNTDNIFEDRATQMVINRDFPKVKFEIKDSKDEIIIYTEYLELHYNKQPFSPNGLFITVRRDSISGTWYYNDITTDLKGTARTLDKADGAVDLDAGLLSQKGFSVIDDSGTMALTDDGWIETRDSSSIDLYFFGYGHHYLDCLKDFYYLCGNTPLLPRYALGNWWSRYYRYTQGEYQELLERFKREGVPFTVSVIDMDWHLVDDVDEKYGSGWTGYTWNKKLFPDHKEFLKWLHKQGMKVALNVHPADGIRAYEEAYPRVARAMGMNPDDKKTVLFDPTSKHFMNVYFDELHHPMEEEGVDFWWLDWQQGSKTKIPGLDPLWMLNHYHYLDSARRGTRPITFSRYAGPGSHRYPIGFSGDTVITWKSLDFQPYFTSTASNIGYGWWSHDIGGHMQGICDDELTARWVQLGAFSPINRLHSSNNPFNGKEPWKYGDVTQKVMKRYLRMRHSMIPYLYTMNRIANKESLPLVQPMYYSEPDNAEAYRVPNEYYFGSQLLVSPITTHTDRFSRMSKVKTWLPEGMWVDFFNGTVYYGGRMLNLWRTIDDIPVLMKQGSIVPLSNQPFGDNSVDNPSSLKVHIFPCKDNEFLLWEDHGDTSVDADCNWANTKFTVNYGNDVKFTIEAAKGNLSVIPKSRNWELLFYATSYSSISIMADNQEIEYEAECDSNTQSLVVKLNDVDVLKKITVIIKDYSLPQENIEEKCFKILERAQIEYDMKAMAIDIIEKLGKKAIPGLLSLELEESVVGPIIEVLTAR